MNIHQSTITHLQEVYFDVCDTLNGQTPEDIGYESTKEMMEEFRRGWPAIKSQKRIEVHVNSISIDEIKRISMQKFL